MNAKKWALTAIAVGLLSACGSSPKEEATTPAATNQDIQKSWCTFDDGKTEAPEFFCTGYIEGFAVTGRGSAAKSAAGMNFMVNQAALAARAELAANVRTQISAAVENAVKQTGLNDQGSIDALSTSAARSVTDESLMGSRIVRRIVGPEGEVYVWVAIDEKNLVSKAQQAIRSSMNNDEAAWQSFQGEKLLDSMDEEIAKLRESKK